MKVAQLCPALCKPTDYTVRGILQARILKWVSFPFSKGSSRLRNRTGVSCITSRFFPSWVTREAPLLSISVSNFGDSGLPCGLISLLCLRRVVDFTFCSTFSYWDRVATSRLLTWPDWKLKVVLLFKKLEIGLLFLPTFNLSLWLSQEFRACFLRPCLWPLE